MKCYIAGQITGNPNYRYDFADAEMVLTALGHTVFNPAVLPCGFSYETYMDADERFLRECDAMVLLPNWERSEGVRREKEIAKLLNKQVCEYTKKGFVL